MKAGRIIIDNEEIKTLLAQAKTVAMIGLSPKPERDSNRVARYLMANGYTVLPVNPIVKTILDKPSFASLDEIQTPVDIVDVFRHSDQVMEHAMEALRLKPKVFWMQLGIENKDAADLLTNAGIHVIMDRCMKIEHQRPL